MNATVAVDRDTQKRIIKAGAVFWATLREIIFFKNQPDTKKATKTAPSGRGSKTVPPVWQALAEPRPKGAETATLVQHPARLLEAQNLGRYKIRGDKK